MSRSPDRFDIRADLAELENLFAFLEDFCARHALCAQLRHDLSLVVEELAVNVIEHGYADTVDGLVRITLRHGSGAVEIVMEDEAPPFDPLKDAGEPDILSGIDERPIGGLGIHFVTTLTRRRSYSYEKGRNVVRLELAAAPT